MNKLTFYLAASFLIAFIYSSAYSQDSEDTIMKKYQPQIEKNRNDYNNKFEKVQKLLIGEYEAAAKRAMQAGKLDLANSLNSLIEEIKEAEPDPDAKVQKQPEASDTILKKYRIQMDQTRADYTNKQTAILKQASGEYEIAIKKAMQSGDLEEANRIKTKKDSFISFVNPANAKDTKSSKNNLEEKREAVRAKYAEENNKMTPEQINEAQQLHKTVVQFANTSEGKSALQQLMEKYPNTQRTATALYSAACQSAGEERIKLFRLAIDEYGDFYWAGKGATVGALSRYMLAKTYLGQGNKKEAAKLVDELRKNFPDAVWPNGEKMAPYLDKDFGPRNRIIY